MAKENNPNSNKFKIGPWLIPGALIAFFLIFTIFSGDSAFEKPTEISSSKFNTYLDKGEIDKVIIYNKTEAEVFLTEAALKEKVHEKVSKNMLDQPNKGPHYTFDIGDIESFQKKLETADKENKLKDYKFSQRGNWSEIFVSLLPIIIIVVIWIFIMRRMSGGGAGGAGGGQIFNIGKSKAKLFDEKNDIKITFKDVAGLEGAKEEIQEIVVFL